jgi:hypothetical protein
MKPFSCYLPRLILGTVALLFVSHSAQAQITIVPTRTLPTAVAIPPPQTAAKNEGAGGKVEAQSVYSHGDPTAEEQQILEMINRARMGPTAEGVRLSTTNDPDVTNAYTQWMTPTRGQVKSDFATYPAKPPLAFNAKLINAARGHSQDMIDNDFQGHNGSNGSTVSDRLVAAGYVATGWSGENVFTKGSSMWDIHASFQIDFGNPGLGHRLNDMNFNDTVFYSEIGIGVLRGSGANVGPIITTYDFGDQAKSFILGVVYNDLNHNGFYDPGEGLAGVTIKPSSGSATAVTSTSGGYAIPYTNGGTINVTASGGSLGTSVTHSVTLAGKNVKVDFSPDKSGLPGIVQLMLPLADTIINQDSARFVWNKVTGATTYHLQVATDSLMKTLIVNDSSITDSQKVSHGLQDGSNYFWRVVAKNAKGVGDYSLIEHFSVAYTPMQTSLISPVNGASLDSAAITFVWKKGTPRVATYHFVLSGHPDLSTPLIEDLASFDTFKVVLAADLTPGATYYWSAQAQNESGFGSLAVTRSFKVIVASVAMSAPTFGAFSSVQPNPTSGSAHIRFNLDRSVNVSLKIFNMLGVCVATLDKGRMTPNDYTSTWNTGDVTSGVYLYQLRVGDKLDMGRIVVDR